MHEDLDPDLTDALSRPFVACLAAVWDKPTRTTLQLGDQCNLEFEPDPDVADYLSPALRAYLGKKTVSRLASDGLAVHVIQRHRTAADPLDLQQALTHSLMALLVLGWSGIADTAVRVSGMRGPGGWQVEGSKLATARAWQAKTVHPDLPWCAGTWEQELPILKRAIDQLYADDTHHRIRRGFRALMRAFEEADDYDRLHGFTRAIDAVFKTGRSSGRNHFKKRGRWFIFDPSGQENQMLGEIYQMRSAIEHCSSWEAVVRSAPPHQRQERAVRRVVEVEQLARWVYLKFLRTPQLTDLLSEDEAMDAFWREQNAKAGEPGSRPSVNEGAAAASRNPFGTPIDLGPAVRGRHCPEQ